MPRMQILTPAEYVLFDTPPHFSSVERKRFFSLSQSLDPLLVSCRTPTNQIGFVLALGYFKATQRFFARQFHEADATYVAKQLGFLPGVFDLNGYDEATARRHRKIIVDYLGFRPFDAHAKQDLIAEIRTMVRSQIRLKVIFLHALDALARRKTETPSAYRLTDLITGEMRRHKHTLTPTGKPPPLAVRLEKALPFRREVAARTSCGGASCHKATPNPKHNAESDRQKAHHTMRQSEQGGRGATHASQPHEGCPLLTPFRGHPASVPLCSAIILSLRL